MPESSRNSEKLIALGRMTRGMVHDFNNSLASISGYAEFLMSDLETGSEAQEFAINIKKASQQMQDLVNQIRAFSMEKKSGEEIPTDLIFLAQQSCGLFQNNLPETCKFSIESDIREATLSVSKLQIQTLILNLLKNSLESLPESGGEIHIRFTEYVSDELDIITPQNDQLLRIVSEVDKEHPCILQIEISDTGCGMDETVLGLALDPFFTTKNAETSHGMGLTIAYGILNHLDAGLQIYTTPYPSANSGTILKIQIPVNEIRSDTSQDDQKNLMAHILLVEDRDMVRHSLETMLVRDGHKVTSCSEAYSALDILREHPDNFDFVMSDYKMPGLTGLEFAQEIHLDFPDMPIILMSGDTENLRDVAHDKKEQNITLLEKPVEHSLLNQAITNILTSATRPILLAEALGR